MTEPDPRAVRLPHVPPDLPGQPAWDEYWAHVVAGKAKAKVLAYFGILGALGSLALHGARGIRSPAGHSVASVGYDRQAAGRFANMWGTSWGRERLGLLHERDLKRS